MGASFKAPEEYKNQAKISSPEEAGKLMKDKKKIVIMTGAGVSAASGIPTFRGQDGFWKKRKTYGGCEEPEKILTKEFF
jgi:NAD-dependent SIR2 family protein deacetylase